MKYPDKKFRDRLTDLIKRVAQGKPGRFAAMVRKYDPSVTNGAMQAYQNSRIPGIDKVWAIAQAGGVSVDWLLGGEPPGESRFKATLIRYLRRRFEAAELDDLDLTDEQILDKLADSLVELTPKKRGK